MSVDIRRVCVFTGSRPGARPAYAEAARALGKELARRKIGLVYGGASVGLMGAVADAVLEGKGEVTGVIPSWLVDREIAHGHLADLRVVGSMHERKKTMADLADAFVALPGGFGTFDEFCEMATWDQLGIHTKPLVLVNVDGYFDGFLMQIDRGVSDGFLKPDHKAMVEVVDDVAAVFDAIARWRSPPTAKWLTTPPPEP